MYSFLDRQLMEARENLNYFYNKSITKIFQFLLKLAFYLMINGLFNFLLINIICILLIIYTIYDIIKSLLYYNTIIEDIKNNLGINDLSFVVDTNLVTKTLLGKEVNYGK